MTQRPHHVVNDDVVVTDPALPEVIEVDLALSSSRIESLHGTTAGARYRHFVAEALAVDPGADRDGVLTLAALAAWRCGAPAFRTDALRRLDLALAAGSPALPALAAALGLPEGDVAPFTALQQHSRFGWPELQAPGDLLAVMGGFRGLFGPWLAPPVAVSATDRPGIFLIRTSADGSTTEDWQLTVDVFGHTLVRLPVDEREPGVSEPHETVESGAAEVSATGAVLRIRGYTVQLRVPETIG
ncbi:hypothetical protein [Cryobacterium sp. PAMC25264]|uniref:hypothetical protein n=1 Tax=Cryobacterium sp. PAMC25264 TaxID=2861288 RepID=UPI001C62BF5E|nr:hypothetical protein [Cryobacterium sp. PAMC25264]QYF73353.1 hypothetical protein KY500_16785 [Cryobacterium sp. PAMC25264]